MTDGDQQGATARWLCSPEAGPPIADARAMAARHPNDPLATAADFRRAHPTLASERAAAVLEQAALAEMAGRRYGISGDWRLTRDGLEAATRPDVARRRAGMVVASGATRVVDLTGGLGFDTRAFLDAGLEVTAVERDPITAAFLEFNCPGVLAIVADARDELPGLIARLAEGDVVFVDPARRDPAAARDARTGRARPERDPERWSPPWSFVAGIGHPRVLAKVAPGFRPPAAWWAEWIGVDRTVVECAVASWPMADGMRRAVSLAGDGEAVAIARTDAAATTSTPLAWIHEPDPAVVQAGALDSLAVDLRLSRIDRASTWLTGPEPARTPLVRSYETLAVLSGSSRDQRRQVAALGLRRLTAKTRDVDVTPDKALRSLGVAEGPDAVLVLTRESGRLLSLLARPASAPAP